MEKEPPNTERLRAQAAFLLLQARTQSMEIARALSSLPAESATRSRLAAAAAQISSVTSELSLALGAGSFPLRASDLMSLGDIVQSGETTSLLSEAAAQAGASSAQTIAVASAAVREEVEDLSRDMFDKRIFDPYLHFVSAEDEARYRQRQAEAQRRIQEQLARQTPQGDLDAAETMQRTMLDAKAHGAGDSPEFAPRMNELNARIDRLRTAMPAKSELDPNRAAGIDPSTLSRRVPPNSGSTPPDAGAGIDFAAMDAKLAAAGLQAPYASQTSGHGLPLQRPPGKPAVSITD